MKKGYSKLMFACQAVDISQVDSLLSQSNINQRDEVTSIQKGDTAIAYAIRAGSLPLTRKLILAGSSLHTLNNAGQSLAFIASGHNQVEILRILIEKGVNINTQDARKWTPLMIASSSGFFYIVQLLLENGADPLTRDCVKHKQYSKSALDRATNPNIAQLLRSFINSCHVQESNLKLNATKEETLLKKSLKLNKQEREDTGTRLKNPDRKSLNPDRKNLNPDRKSLKKDANQYLQESSNVLTSHIDSLLRTKVDYQLSAMLVESRTALHSHMKTMGNKLEKILDTKLTENLRSMIRSSVDYLVSVSEETDEEKLIKSLYG